jgi:hypothetical protein
MNWATARTASKAPGLMLDAEAVSDAALPGTWRLSTMSLRLALRLVIWLHQMLAIFGGLRGARAQALLPAPRPRIALTDPRAGP